MTSPELQFTQLDTELLIREVKARPTLYSMEDSRYNDVNYKRRLWEDIASVLFENVWSNYNEEEKADKVDLVQKRWKNLRACFSRELRRQKDKKWVYGVAYKRRKYLYFNDLSFLKSEYDIGEEEVTHEIDLPEKTEADNTTVILDTNIEELIAIPEPKFVLKPNPENTVINSSLNTTNEYPDSTNFALSLVPMLNMIPMHKRIDAQIEVLSVLKRFCKNDSDDPLESDDGAQKRSVCHTKKYGKKRKEDIAIAEIKSEVEIDDDD